MKVEIQDVKEIWCNVLGMDEVDADDKFYDLGGNSVMLLIILDEVYQKYELELPVNDVTQFDTVNKMTEYIKEHC